MELDGEDHLSRIETYYNALNEINAVIIRKRDTSHSKEEIYCNSQTEFKEVIERKGRVKEQVPDVRLEFFESAKQSKKDYLSKMGELVESVEQNRVR